MSGNIYSYILRANIVAMAFLGALSASSAALELEGLEQEAEFVCPTDNAPPRQSYREHAKAEALYRCEFLVPEECSQSMKFQERVTLQFDINVNGVPENISVLKSTNDCLNSHAILTLAAWRYEPLAAPEFGAEVTFRLYSHSDAYRNHNLLRDVTRPGG